MLNGVVAVPVMVRLCALPCAHRHLPPDTWGRPVQRDQRVFILRRHRLTVVVNTETDHAIDFAALNGVTPPPSPH